MQVELGPNFETSWDPQGADFALMLGVFYCRQLDAPVIVEIRRDGVVTPFDEVLASVQALFPALRYEIEPGEPPKSKSAPLDISAAKEHLGWEPRFSVRAAFADFLAELKAARG